MFNKLICLFLIIVSFSFASEATNQVISTKFEENLKKDLDLKEIDPNIYNFYYLKLSTIYYMPELIGGGYRTRNNNTGIDASISLICPYPISSLNFAIASSVNFNYYINNSSVYLGVGPWLCLINYFPITSPEFVIGNQWKTKSKHIHFIQLQTNWPIYSFIGVFGHSATKPLSLYPIIGLSYGFGF